MKTRRSLLAAVVPLLVGGCIADTPATDQPTTSPPKTTEHSPSDRPSNHTSTPDCMRGYTVSLSSFTPTEQLATPLRPAQQRLFERILTEDGLVLQTYGKPPIRTDRYVASDGAYYRVDFEQVGTEEVPARRADLSWKKGQEAPTDETVIAYADLSEADQIALDYLIHGPEYSREGLPTQGMSITDSPAPYQQGTADSVLVGEGTTWIEWDDRVYEVTITTEERTLTRRTYDYRATRVADSAETFREYVADRYLTPLDNLSSEEKSILEAAAEAGEYGQYEDCKEPSTGYKALKQRMEKVSDLPDPHNDHWYVSYEGERYLLEIGSWVV